MNPIADEIEVWKTKLNEKVFKKIFRAFKCLSKNDDEEVEDKIFVTEGSVLRNLTKIFGYKNDYLGKRLYAIIAKKEKGKKVFFP